MENRGVSNVIGVVFIISVVLILSTLVIVSLFGITGVLSDPAPSIGQATTSLESQSGHDGGIYQSRMIAGDQIDVEELELIVDAQQACGETERLGNFEITSTDFDDENVLSSPGTGFIDGSFQGESTVGVLSDNVQSTWEAGEHIGFRITGSDCELSENDTVIVRYIHIPSDTMFLEDEVSVTEN